MQESRVVQITRLSFFSLGLVVFSFVHLFQLDLISGFHYDEAWSALFSYDIAFKPGFWPYYAQSPYTSPWMHYWVAGVFKLMGASVWSYRFATWILTTIGVLLLCLTLSEKQHQKVASLLPWVIAATPALVLNHRFAIEMHSLHVFCFGLLIYSIHRDWRWGRVAAILIGVTGHILFIGPVLAIYLMVWKDPSVLKSYLLEMRILSFVLFLFFIKVAIEIPEKDKGIALMGIGFFSHVALYFKTLKNTKGLEKWINFASFIGILSIPAVFFFTPWSTWLVTGQSQLGGVTLGIAIGRGLLGVIFLWLFIKKWSAFPKLFQLAGLTGLFTSFVMLKAAPRYFEIALLLVSVLVAFVVVKMDLKRGVLVFGLTTSLGLASLWNPVLKAYQGGQVQETSFRMGPFTDSSWDFLNKKAIVDDLINHLNHLNDRGCSLLKTLKEAAAIDTRVLESLIFYSKDKSLDHAELPSCPGLHLWRSAEVLEPLPQDVSRIKRIEGFTLWFD